MANLGYVLLLSLLAAVAADRCGSFGSSAKVAAVTVEVTVVEPTGRIPANRHRQLPGPVY